MSNAVNKSISMQSWGLDKQQHEGHKVLKRFMQNIADVGGCDRVEILQQSSWSALANLLCTQAQSFDVGTSMHPVKLPMFA